MSRFALDDCPLLRELFNKESPAHRAILYYGAVAQACSSGLRPFPEPATPQEALLLVVALHAAKGVTDIKSVSAYPKISLTLSKIEDPRSAGLFSTFSDAPNCSISLRCSRVSFVGV